MLVYKVLLIINYWKRGSKIERKGVERNMLR